MEKTNLLPTVKKQITKLNPNQELFCQLYVSDEEYMGNGTMCYAEAYKVERVGNWYMNSASSANRLLKNVKVSQRLNELLQLVLNDNLVDTELTYTIQQKGDLSSKVKAIQEYNKLKSRIKERETSQKVIIINIAREIAEQNNIKLDANSINASPSEHSSRPT